MYFCRELYFEMYILSEKSYLDILWIKFDYKFFEFYIYLVVVYILLEYFSGNNDLELIYLILFFDFEKYSELGNIIIVFMMILMFILIFN